MSDQLVAETSTWQHTTLTTDKYPCPRWDSNPRSQQVSGLRPLTCWYFCCNCWICWPTACISKCINKLVTHFKHSLKKYQQTGETLHAFRVCWYLYSAKTRDPGYILIYIQQDAMLHSLFYLETAVHVSGGTITHHQEHKELYLQHLVIVTPYLLSATIVEELELVWVCCGWRTSTLPQ